ncbi:MAG: hypothetical protein ACYSVY_21470 [Planctomycetota bacterium]
MIGAAQLNITRARATGTGTPIEERDRAAGRRRAHRSDPEFGTLWSVTLTGPGEQFRNVSFTAEEHRLAEAIEEAIGDGSAEPAREAEPSDLPTAVPVEERTVYERCQKAILVTYEEQPNDAKQPVPLACPHCWALNQIEVGAWAAAGGDYRADKA